MSFPHLCQHKGEEGINSALLLSHAQGQLPCTAANRVSSTVLLSPGAGPSIPIIIVGERQVQFALVLQLVKGGLNLCICILSSVLTGAADIHMDRGTGRAVDADMAFAAAQAQRTLMAAGDSIGHSDLCDPNRSVDLRD